MNALLGQTPPQVFAAYTDPRRAQALLQAHAQALFGHARQLQRCSVLHSTYRSYVRPASWAKSTLSVCYRVDFDGEDDAILYAKIFLDGQSEAAWASLEQEKAPPNAAPRHISALDMIVWRFPEDPAMPQLATLLAPEQMRAYLPYAKLPPGLCYEDLAQLSVRRVGYVPEHACTVRYQLTFQAAHQSAAPTRAASAPQSLTLYAKTYRTEKATEVCRRHEHLWKAAGSGATALKMAQALGCDRELNVFWLLGVTGGALSETLNVSNYECYLKQAAQGIALVHGSDMQAPAAVSLTELSLQCLKKIDKLSAVQQTSASRLEAIRARVLRAPMPRATRLIHGDFHIGQLLVDGECVRFLDFDSCVMGEPEQDLAEFIVSLLFARFAPDLVRAMAAVLLEAYAAHAAWAIQLECLRWHAHVQYVTRAQRIYRELRPGWEQSLQRCLEELNVDEVLPARPISQPVSQ